MITSKTNALQLMTIPTCLASVAQWLECSPMHQEVDSSIPCQGTCCVVDSIPSRGYAGRSGSMLLSHRCFTISLPLSPKSIKHIKKNSIWNMETNVGFISMHFLSLQDLSSLISCCFSYWVIISYSFSFLFYFVLFSFNSLS